MGTLYQDLEILDQALSCFFEALSRYLACINEVSLQVAGCYSAIAVSLLNLDLIEKALLYQETSHEIIHKLQSADSLMSENSLELLDFMRK
jgi:hypothetical protein